MIKKAEVFKWWVADTFSWEEIQDMARGKPSLKDGLKFKGEEQDDRRYGLGNG